MGITKSSRTIISTNKTRKLIKSNIASTISKRTLLHKNVSLNPVIEMNESTLKRSPEDVRFKVENHLFDNYYKLKFLGQGVFGKVFQTHKKDSPSGNTYAAKVIKYIILRKKTSETGLVETISRDISNTIQNEVNILRKLSPSCKEYILCLKDSYIDNNSNNFYIIMEDLSSYRPITDFIRDNYFSELVLNIGPVLQPIEVVDKNNKLDKLANIFNKLIKGLNLIHSKNIVHRDIKPDNILFNAKTEEIKYIDFGLSCDLDNKIQSCFGYAGTPNYIDPLLREMQKIVQPHIEKIKENVENGDKVFDIKNLMKYDYWSLGISMYEMICGKKPPDYLYSIIKKSEERKIIYNGIYNHQEFYIKYPKFINNKYLRNKIYSLSTDYLKEWNKVENVFKSIVEVSRKNKKYSYIIINDIFSRNLKKRILYNV